MSEEKKVEQIGQTAEAGPQTFELSEEDLGSIAGGASNDVKGIDIVVKKKGAGIQPSKLSA